MSSTAVPEDSGVMRCICGFDHDDDFTIQCENCNTWQHAVCVDIYDESSIPDKYMCSQCSSRTVDPAAARERQMKLLVKTQRKTRGQPSQRGRKKRSRGGDDDREASSHASTASQSSASGTEEKDSTVVSRPEVYFVRAVVNSFTPAAERYWHSLSPERLNRVRHLDNVDALKPVAMVVIRRHRYTGSLLASRPSSPTNVAAATAQLAPTTSIGSGLNTGGGIAKRISPILPSTAAFGLNGLGVVANQPIGVEKFVIEFTGEICLRTEYKRESINQWSRQGCPKQGTLFIPHFPLAIDGRKHGSEALFFRRSRSPNVRFEPNLDSKGSIRMLGYATEPIKPGTELTIGWDWAPGHPIYKLGEPGRAHLGELEQRLLDEVSKLVHEPVLGECLPQDLPEWARTIIDGDEESAELISESVDDKAEAESLSSVPQSPSNEVPRKQFLPSQRVTIATLLRRNFNDNKPQTPRTEALVSTISIPSVPVQNIWVPAQFPAQATIGEPPKKKRLSLADYKRKFSS